MKPVMSFNVHLQVANLFKVLFAVLFPWVILISFDWVHPSLGCPSIPYSFSPESNVDKK